MYRTATLLFIASLLPASSATLVYWDGTKDAGSDALVDKGTLGINAVRATNGTGGGTWAVLPNGGPGGAGDAYLNLASGTNFAERTTFSLPESTFNLKNQSWAISGWFNRSGGGTDMVFHFGSGDGFGGENELYLYGTGSNGATLQNYNTNDVNISGSGLAAGNWQSYAINFSASGLDDGKGTIQYYLNGSLVGSDNTFTLQFDQTKLSYGGITNAGTASNDRNFDGGVDDFALYDTTLTAAQVTALHNRTATPLTIPEPSAALLGLLGAITLLLRKKR